MSVSTIAAPPLTTPIAGKLFMTQNWADWFVLQIMTRLQTSSQLLASPTTLTNQTASIGATPFALGTVNAGLYMVSLTARVTTAASVSSSITPLVFYTRGGASCTQSSLAPMISNSTSLPSSWVFILNSDGGAPISYGTTYASSGAPAMIYELDATCENIK